MIKSTTLAPELVQAAELVAFTTALSGALSYPLTYTSAAVAVAAGKALLVSFEATSAAHYVVDISKDAGVTWKNLEAFDQQDTARRSVRVYTSNGETWQVRFNVTAYATISAYKVAYQLRG